MLQGDHCRSQVTSRDSSSDRARQITRFGAGRAADFARANTRQQPARSHSLAGGNGRSRAKSHFRVGESHFLSHSHVRARTTSPAHSTPPRPCSPASCPSSPVRLTTSPARSSPPSQASAPQPLSSLCACLLAARLLLGAHVPPSSPLHPQAPVRDV